MPKSIYALGAIGVLGCLMLSFMMKHLLAVQQERSASPIAEALQDAFVDHLAGPVQVALARVGGVTTLVVKMTTRAGVQRDRLIASTDTFLWRDIDRLQERPQVVHFEVADAGGGPPVVVDLRPPGSTVPAPSGASAPLRPASGKSAAPPAKN